MEHERYVWHNVIDFILVGIGVIGNMMVITVILRTKDMRNSINIFLANLAIADLIILVTLGTKLFFDYYLGFDVITLNNVICKGVPFILTWTYRTSVLTLLAIGFDRYYAICTPLKAVQICTKKRAYRICFLVWVLAAVFTSLIFSTLIYFPEEYSMEDDTIYESVCGFLLDSFLSKADYYIGSSVFFVFPLITLIVLHIIISCHLKGASSVNTAAVRHRRHVIKMLRTVVLLFFICNLPSRLFKFFSMIWPDQFTEWQGLKTFKFIKNVSSILIYTHSALNPILYSLMSKKFRVGFRNFLYDTTHCFSKVQSSSCLHTVINNTRTTPTNTSSV